MALGLLSWPAGDGEMACRIRAFDWSITPLGPIDGWPQSLRTAVELTMAAPFANVLLWGPQFIVAAYNAGYRTILNDKPEALGRSMLDVWAEERALLEPQLARVLDGETLLFKELPMSLDRGFESDQSWFDYGYGPVRDETGAAAGIVVTIGEITHRMAIISQARDNEARYRTLFEAIDSGFCILEMIFDESGRAIDYRFVEVNPAFERQSGLVAAVGRRIREFTDNLEEHWFERYGRVALTGEPMRVEGEVASLGRWFDINAFRVGGPEQRRIAVLFTDVSERRHAEAAARESEARQAFLLELSDALRAEPSAEAIADRALRMLLEQMRLDRCYIGIYRLAEDIGEFPHQVHDDRLPPLPAQVRLSDFPEAVRAAFNRTLVIDDVVEMEGLSDIDRASFDGLGLRALIAATLRKGENNPLWAIVAVSAHPRVWAQGEVSLVEEVAERTWAAMERARAETTLHASQTKYRMLFDAMDQGFYIAEVVEDDTGRAVDRRFLEVNPAMERISGLSNVVGRFMSELAPDAEAHWIEPFADVVRTGEPRHVEDFNVDTGRWYHASHTRIGGQSSRLVGVVFDDITERKQAEANLRASEAQQAFLLKFSDALRPHGDPVEVQAAALRVLGEHLGAVRAQYWEAEPDGRHVRSEGGYAKEGPRISGRVRLNDFGVHVIEAFAAGLTLAVSDVKTDPLASEEVLAAYDAVGVRAHITVPLVKDGRLVALLAIHHTAARDWTSQEIALAKEAAERTWSAVERASAETDLAASEGRYHDLLDSIDEGFCVLEMIADDAGGFRDYRYLQTNPMFEVQTGLADPIGRTALELAPGLERWWIDTYGQVATTGEARRFEHGSENLGRWFDVYAARVGEPGQLRVALLFRDISERKRAEGHRQMLIDELNHRVKNTLAVVQGLAQQTFRVGGDSQAARLAFDLRLVALATAHDILTRENWVSADLAELVRTALAVHAGKDGRMVVEGPPVRLSPQTAVSITLALHELATNAVKYGALSIDAGSVEMRWTHDEHRLCLTWLERDGPPVEPPSHRGFGTRLIERVFATELKAKVTMEFAPEGLVCRIDAHLPASC